MCVDPATGQTVACPSADAVFAADSDTSDSSDSSVKDGSGKDGTDSGEVSVDGKIDSSEVGAEVDSGICATGDKKCLNKTTVQTCKNGVWGQDSACASNEECSDGACGCPNACKAFGLVECLPDVAAVKTCQLDSNKCLSWGVPIACKPGEICETGVCKKPGGGGCSPACGSGQVCQNGACVTVSGSGLTCSQIVACTANCLSGDTACTDDCLAKGSASAQSLLGDYKTCISSICKSLADQGKSNDAMACIFSNCFEQQAACIGSGSTACDVVNDCMTNCSGGASCINDCNKNASKGGGIGYYTLQGCMDANCNGQTGDALIDCAKTQCSSSFISCFSPIGPGQTLTSCAAIAQCEAKCSGKVLCAKACVAQGTTQAQADVNAFINCRDYKCGSYCPSSPDCSTCVQLYCANELAACAQ